MPFKSFEELMDMSQKDPKMALMLVNRAKNKGQNVVDENNPGYRNPSSNKRSTADQNPRMNAIKKRMEKMQPSSPDDQTEDVVNRRKSMGY